MKAIPNLKKATKKFTHKNFPLRVVTRQGKQDKQIQEFLEYRKMMKNIVKQLEKQQQNITIETTQ